MTDWSSYRQQEIERFIDALAAAGFRPVEKRTLIKDHLIPALGRDVPLSVTVTDDFPYKPPKVFAEDGSGSASWHRDPDHALCLWSPARSGSQPWTDPATLLVRVEDWFARDAAGWPDDPPDLDLERYWNLTGGALLVYDGLGTVPHGSPLIVYRSPREHDIVRVTVGSYRHGSQRADEQGVYVNLGELTRPPRVMDEILDLCETVETGSTDRIGHLLNKSSVRWLLVRYERQQHPALLALRRPPKKAWGFVESAEESTRITDMRVGPDAEALAEKTVAIVGIGAIGSFLAEQLLRAGVGTVTLVDGARLRPGNLPRHLADPSTVGLAKPDAVKTTLTTSNPFLPERIHTIAEHATLDELHEHVTNSDLVICATGAAHIEIAFCNLADLTGRTVLLVALYDHGSTLRIDRAPLQGNEHPAPPEPPPDHDGLQYESGCGDPVSPTPPWACVAAAAVTCGHAVAVLAGRTVPPTTRITGLCP